MNPPNDKFIAKDKALHFICSAAIVGLSFHSTYNQLGYDKDDSRIFSISLTGLIGIGKEIMDSKKKPSSSSWRDLLADAVGIAAGVLIFTIYERKPASATASP
jgi:uncharacterized protein YfiM (DUF2279 family)